MATDPTVYEARIRAARALSAVNSIDTPQIVDLTSPRLDAIRDALESIEPLCRMLEADQAGPDVSGCPLNPDGLVCVLDSAGHEALDAKMRQHPAGDMVAKWGHWHRSRDGAQWADRAHRPVTVVDGQLNINIQTVPAEPPSVFKAETPTDGSTAPNFGPPARDRTVETPSGNIDAGRDYAKGGYIHPKPNLHLQDFDALMALIRYCGYAQDTLARLVESKILSQNDSGVLRQLASISKEVVPLMRAKPTKAGS